MVKAYREYKVSELKEQLTERSLPVSGTKPELIARLEANDAETSEAKADDPEPAPKAEAAPAQAAPAPAAPAPAPAAPAPKPVPVPAPVPAVDPTEAAIKDLEKRIERMRRFGEPTEELDQQLKRIKRFGYTPPVKSTGDSRPRSGHRNKRRNGQRPVKVTK